MCIRDSLHDELRGEPLVREPPLDAHHCELHQIRRRALNGHVQRHALAEGAEVVVAALQLRKGAAPVHERLDVAVGARLFDDAVHIGTHAGVRLEIPLHILLRLGHRYADVL